MSQIEWTTEKRKLSELIPQEENPRRINSEQAERLQQSWQEYGQVETVAVSPDGVIYNGHQRYFVLSQLYGPDYEVDCRVASRPLTEQEWKRLTVLLHEGATGEWNFDILAGWDVATDELLDWGFDPDALSAHGFEIGDFDLPEIESGAFSDEQIINAAFAHFRKAGFPYRNLPVHVCMQQINKLADTEPERLLRTSTAYHVADTYHPHRFHAAAEGMKSPVDAFADDKLLRRAMRLCLDNEATLPAGIWGSLLIVSGVQACANFRPGFASFLYRKYAAPGDTILDCSTGYGGRLVGFMASRIAGKYVGIDPNTPTHESNLRLASELGFADKVELLNLPVEDVPHSLLAESCDFAFTSPPYFAKEHYSEDETQSWVRYKTGDEWRAGFLVPFFELQLAALKPGKLAIVNIADVKLRNQTYPLERWAQEDGVGVGFEYVRTDNYELTHRFGKGNLDEVATEAVLIFRKPEVAE